MNSRNKFQLLLIFMCISTLGWSQIGMTTLGTGAGQNNTTNYTTYIGYQSGINGNGFGSTFIGAFTGTTNTGSSNTFIGGNAGRFNLSGRSNVFLGFQAGDNNTTGSYNVFSGHDAGGQNSTGKYNVFSGYFSGQANIDGGYNTYIGTNAGRSSTGSYNVFLGYRAGYSETGSHRLYIENSDTSDPLIYGDFQDDVVGINTSDVPAGYTLAVKGKTITEEVKVRTHDNWPDYVFEENYDLSPLNILENNIKTLGHLPGVPSAEEVKDNGFHLGEMNATLLEKVEELTLYLIQMNKEMKAMNSNIQKLEIENKNLQTQLKTLNK